MLEDGPDLDDAVARAKVEAEAQVVLEAYPIDVVVSDGVPVPVRLRERIRAERGPTVVYGDAERTKLQQRSAEHVDATGSSQEAWSAAGATGT